MNHVYRWTTTRYGPLADRLQGPLGLCRMSLFFCPDACYAPAMRARQIATRAKSLAVLAAHSWGVRHTDARSFVVPSPVSAALQLLCGRVSDTSLRHDWRAF